ncbi:GtrA family protein [Luteimicrobium sp. DT211]|uniref:GtrA family protein n=1 Tax=Luteimicrobium sp. DT211 TaxID=3393412 RepID=UPI003CF98E74
MTDVTPAAEPGRAGAAEADRHGALPLVLAASEAPGTDVAHVAADTLDGSPAAAATAGEASATRRPRLGKDRLYELAKFGSVGAVSFVVDLGLFNLLQFGPGHLLDSKPLTARVVSVAVATLVAWVGNRLWTFSERRTENRSRELAGFLVVNVGGLLIGIGVLALFVYPLGLDSPLEKNLANLLGIGLGTIFRYFAYRHLVFTGDRSPAK